MRREASSAVSGFSPIRVLLVDDDEDSFILTRHQLAQVQAGNIRLDWAPSYEAGLARIMDQNHDVYLVDYRLGARTGLDLLREALAAGCKAPIIMLTTENPAVDSEAMRLGAADFLSKERLDAPLLERSIRYSIKHFATLRALRESEARLASFMQNVPCAIAMKAPDGTYVYVNETFDQAFGDRDRDCVGRSDEELWPRPTALRLRKVDQQVIQSKQPVQTTEVMHHGSAPRSWLITKFPILDERSQVAMLGFAGIDITESKRLEREIQQISEAEQNRIGRDLHDGLGQYLTGIACMVKVLEQKLAAQALKEAADARRITAMVNETIAQTRDLARGLCPVELETNGLQAALQELAAHVAKVFQISCLFRSPQRVSVYDNASAVHLYRIAQEALSNAVKHGRATEILLSLTTANGALTLLVEDNGSGLPAGVEQAKGMGLRVMRHRAGMIGAVIHFHGRPHGGTTVTCVLENKLRKSPAPGRAKAKRRRPAPRAARPSAARS